MAYTLDQLQQLQEALASGERLVRFGDRWVEYRSIDELRAAINDVKAALALEASPGRVRSRQLRMSTSKGF